MHTSILCRPAYTHKHARCHNAMRIYVCNECHKCMCMCLAIRERGATAGMLHKPADVGPPKCTIKNPCLESFKRCLVLPSSSVGMEFVVLERYALTLNQLACRHNCWSAHWVFQWLLPFRTKPHILRLRNHILYKAWLVALNISFNTC